ncbi:MAG: peptide ABC transporter substrate-binding protein [Planctomycetales bacterium]|nr:peptide ABC transporter substrate-binding protein [Planctomycetales bacterium]
MHVRLIRRRARDSRASFMGAALVNAALLMLATGCKPPHPDYFGTVKPRHPPNELWVNNGGEPEWIDPGKCSDSNGGEVIFNTFAGLVEAHPKTLAPMPALATHWEVSDDQATYTFHLRKSNWSDGTPLTAHDFVYSFRRLLDYKTASKYATNGYIFKNGEMASLRAILVRGLPAGATEEQVRAWAAEVMPVRRVSLEGEAATLFVLSQGEDEEEEQSPSTGLGLVDRDAIVAELSKRPFGADKVPLQVEVATLEMIGARALDDHTLEIELENPIPYFLSFMTFYSFMPVPRHVIERLEQEGLNPDLWTRAENIVCNGPFRLVQWKFRQYMEFARNPEYWDAEHVKLERIRALMVESYVTGLNMYNAGDIDWTGGQTGLPSEFMDHLKKYRDFHQFPEISVYFYWLNTKRAPLDNPKLRRAMSLALNRKTLVERVTRANQIPTQDLVPDGLAGYEGLKRPIYDPDAARALLKEAGYASGADVPEITLSYNTSETHKQVAEAVQQMWKKELGLRVVLENQEWKTYLSRMAMMDFQIARMGWVGDYADPYTFLELLTTDCGNNHSNWSNPEYDRLLKEANRQANDKDKRLQLMREAEALAMEEQPIIPFYIYTRSQMVKPYVRGIWENYQDRHPWKYVWIDDAYYQGVPEQRSDDPPPPEPN